MMSVKLSIILFIKVESKILKEYLFKCPLSGNVISVKKKCDQTFCVSIQGGWRKGAPESSEGPAGGRRRRQHRAFGGLIPRPERRGGKSRE